MLHRALATVFALTLSTSVASGHEFWIDPETFRLAPGDTIAAQLRVGQAYEGSAQVYNPGNFRRFEIAAGGETTPVDGRLGDRPALSAPAREGLNVVVHVTKDFSLTYNKGFEQFADFVTHKDAEWAIAAHRARGLPESGFREIYSRYAKSLVAAGSGAGQDFVAGLETELTALKNPYTDDVSDGLPVSLTYQGAPRGEAQVEVFEKDPAGEVTVFTLRTDNDGVALVPVRPGHRYMLDAVVLREPEREDAVWESLWANLTFAVPAP